MGETARVHKGCFVCLYKDACTDMSATFLALNFSHDLAGAPFFPVSVHVDNNAMFLGSRLLDLLVLDRSSCSSCHVTYFSVSKPKLP